MSFRSVSFRFGLFLLALWVLLSFLFLDAVSAQGPLPTPIPPCTGGPPLCPDSDYVPHSMNMLYQGSLYGYSTLNEVYTVQSDLADLSAAVSGLDSRLASLEATMIVSTTVITLPSGLDLDVEYRASAGEFLQLGILLLLLGSQVFILLFNSLRGGRL